MMMTERLLQFIWQFQYFNTAALETTCGEPLLVLHPGQWNNHQGPDFHDVRVRIADKTWAGNAELHLRTSDWHRHAHHTDENYENVILHIVWTNDDHRLSESIPTLVLEDRVSRLLLRQYESWMHESAFIPCAGHRHDPDDLIWVNWKERMLAERLERRSAYIRSLLQINKDHWEETMWWMMARNFGLFVNADAFEELARSLPLTIIARHRAQVIQLEALLLGQAALLNEDHADPYFILLKKEYRFLRLKYGLREIYTPVHFLRMRPPAFPTIRLALLAMLLHKSVHLFASLLAAADLTELQTMLDVTANDFWHYHYTFGHRGNYHPKALGRQMIHNIIVNTFVPLVFAFGKLHQDHVHVNKALNWLAKADAENNTLTQGFAAIGIRCRNAGDSQALLELKTQYCDKKRCLDCAIGKAILTATGRPEPSS